MAEVRHLGYFPYCLGLKSPADPPSDWIYSCWESNLESAMALYWRIKKFRITVSGHFERWSLAPPEYTTLVQDYSYDATETGTIEINVASEKKLVCATPFGGPSWTFEGAILNEGGGNNGAENTAFKPFWTSDKIKYYTGVPLVVYFEDPVDNRNALGVYIGFPPVGDPYWEGVTNVTSTRETINFGRGVEADTTLVYAQQTATSSTGYNIATVPDFKIEAAEWWEYDPNDGKGPIYDKVTGAKIRTDRGMGPPWSSQ